MRFNRALLGRFGAEVDDAVSAEIFMAVQQLPFQCYDDVPATLRVLRERPGISLGVLSNWTFTLPTILHHVGIDTLFERILTSHALGAAKPDPACFRLALQCIGATRAVYVGDSLAMDVLPALEAGVSPILVDRRLRYCARKLPCPRIETLAQLLDVLP